MKVILATCEESIDKYLEENAASWGLEIRTVARDQMSLAKWLDQETNADVLLINRFLPGPLPLSAILFEAKQKRIRPILLLLGEGDEEIIQDVFRLGVYDFLIGRYGPKQLQVVINVATKREEAMQYVKTFYPSLEIQEPKEETLFTIRQHPPAGEEKNFTFGGQPVQSTVPSQSITLSQRPTTYAVYSAKGGVGKSNIAVNVGGSFLKSGRTTVLVDTDVHQGVISSILKINAHFSVIDWMNFPDDMDEKTILHSLGKHRSGLYCLPSPMDYLGHPLKEELFQKIQRNLAKCFSTIIFDTDGNFTKSNIKILKSVDYILYVMTSDQTSLERHRQTVNRFIRLGIQPEKIKIILNDPTNIAKNGDAEFIAEKLKPIPVGTLSYSRQLQRCSEEGDPVVLSRPKDPFSRELQSVLRKLLAIDIESVEVEEKQKRRTWRISLPFFSRG